MLYTFIMLLLGITAIAMIFLATRVWGSRQSSPAISVSMAALLSAVALWLVFYILEIILQDYTLKDAVWRAKFIGIVIVPVAWFTFAVHYTSNSEWLSSRNRLLLTIVPILTTLIVWTNGNEGIMWQNARLSSADGFTVFVNDLGIWFWIHSAYSYILLVAGTFLLLRRFISAPAVYRRQLIALVIAVVFPVVANAITILAKPLLDLTPLAFAVTGLSFTWGMLRYQLLDLAPIARNTVIESMTDSMLVIDNRGRIVDINSAGASLINQKVSESIGKPLSLAIPFIAQQPEIIDKYRVERAIQDEVSVENENGNRHFDVRVSPLFDGQNQINGRVIILRDITERKRAEEKIRAQNEALVKANHELIEARQHAEIATELKSQFLANMSHELRTPLNAIIGYTEIQLAGMAGELNDEQQRYQERILANSEQLLGLINDVLDISKIEAGRMSLVRKPFVVRTWLDGIVKRTQVLADAKNLALVVKINDDLPNTLVEDSDRLQQIVINLLSNAIKFTENGQIGIHLGRHDGACWKIVVSDTGIGIPIHAYETIFEEFRQVDGSSRRRYGGTGLGLAIVKQLAHMMDGTVQLHSTLGVGSTFTIVLPFNEIALAAP